MISRLLRLPWGQLQQLNLTCYSFFPSSSTESTYSLNVSSFTIPVVKPKFMCRRHSEAKQTKTLEFGAQKGLLQGLSKEKGQLMLKRPKLPDSFGGRVFKDKIWGEGCRVCDFLLIGWWWGNRVMFQEYQPLVPTSLGSTCLWSSM